MEHNTDRILWTVLILAIGVALYVGFRPAANGVLHQVIDKTQAVATNVNSNPSSSSSANSSSSSSSTNTAVGANLLTGTAKFEFGINNNLGVNSEQQTIQKYDDETNYVQDTSNTPTDYLGSWWQFTPTVGHVYTLSADVCGNGYITGDYFHYEGADTNSLGRVDLTNNWQRISNTFHVNTTNGWRNWTVYAHNSNLLKIKHIKIEEGPAATPWVP